MAANDELSPVHCLVESDGPVTTVTLNRPERRNGLDSPLLRELEAIFCRVRDDGRTRALILTGAGTVFCAGASPAAAGAQGARGDLSGSPAGGPRMIGRIFDLLAHLDVMTVAAVNGHAIGGGWSLALAADYCVAVPDAQFWVPEVDFGVPFRGLSSFALTHRLGPWLAKEATILCRRFGAEELRGLGVINRVVEPERLMDEAREVAARFAAQPARAANATKRDVNAVIYGPATTERTGLGPCRRGCRVPGAGGRVAAGLRGSRGQAVRLLGATQCGVRRRSRALVREVITIRSSV